MKSLMIKAVLAVVFGMLVGFVLATMVPKAQAIGFCNSICEENYQATVAQQSLTIDMLREQIEAGDMQICDQVCVDDFIQRILAKEAEIAQLRQGPDSQEWHALNTMYSQCVLSREGLIQERDDLFAVIERQAAQVQELKNSAGNSELVASVNALLPVLDALRLDIVLENSRTLGVLAEAQQQGIAQFAAGQAFAQEQIEALQASNTSLLESRNLYQEALLLCESSN